MSYLKVLILFHLKQNERNCPIRSLTITQMSEGLHGMKRVTLYKNLMELEAMGLVERGFKNGRADTFYISQKGIETYYEVGGKDNDNCQTAICQ